MPDLTEILSPLAGGIVEALLNGVWQGLVVAAFAWLLLRRIPDEHAALRFRIRCFALAVVVLLPVVPAFVAGE